jgi:uncharacterized membrane protein
MMQRLPSDKSGRWLAVFSALLLPVVYLVFVPVLQHLAHGEPGGWVGFRTRAATASVENWRSAQTMAATHFLIIGLTFLVLTLITYFWLSRTPKASMAWWWRAFYILLGLQLVALFASIFIIDNSLPRPATSQVTLATSEVIWPVIFGLLTPVLLLLCAPFLRYCATQGRSMYSGHRTEASMRSPGNWELANNLSAKVCLYTGIVSTLAALLTFAALWNSGNHNSGSWWLASVLFVLVPAIPLLIGLVVIERKLNSRTTS